MVLSSHDIELNSVLKKGSAFNLNEIIFIFGMNREFHEISGRVYKNDQELRLFPLLYTEQYFI